MRVYEGGREVMSQGESVMLHLEGVMSHISCHANQRVYLLHTECTYRGEDGGKFERHVMTGE